MNAGPYSVKGIKSFKGREGYGFNAVLLCNGKKVAEVIDDANGGTFRFHWLNPDRFAAVVDAEALADHVKTLPPLDLGPIAHCGAPIEVPQDADGFLAALVEDAENAQRMRASLKRLLKNRIVFVLDGEVKQTKPTAVNVPALGRAKLMWPSATILNLLPFNEAEALFVQHVAKREL